MTGTHPRHARPPPPPSDPGTSLVEVPPDPTPKDLHAVTCVVEFRGPNPDHAVEVLQSGWYIGWVWRDRFTPGMPREIAKAARAWAGWGP
jgi:hypothetical protein